MASNKESKNGMSEIIGADINLESSKSDFDFETY